MKILRTIIGALLVVVVLSCQSWAALSVYEIMQKMEESQDITEDLTVKSKLTHQKPEQGVKKSEFVYYRRDTIDAFLMVAIAPDAEKGNGYLRVNDNMWMYRRNTRTFQMIKRDQSIGGSDADAGDMEKKKFTELFEPALDEQGNEMLVEETLGKAKIPVYRFELKAKVKDVKHPKVIFWVRQDNLLSLKEESYSVSGTLMETSYYPKYTKVKNKYIPTKMIFINEFEKGEKTVMELSGISLNPIDEAVFTKAYLENLSK